MSKFCPRENRRVVYLVCQECDEKLCEMEPQPSCSDCAFCNKIKLGGIDFVKCEKTNRIIREQDIMLSGCKYRKVGDCS